MSTKTDHENKTPVTPQRRRQISTLLFVIGMVAIFFVMLFLSRLDRPPAMPETEEHHVTEKKPNAICIECHAIESLPKQHPLDYEKFACTRCHLPAGKEAR